MLHLTEGGPVTNFYLEKGKIQSLSEPESSLRLGGSPILQAEQF